MGVLHKTKVKVSPSEIHGKGVFAAHSLSRSDLVLALDELRFVDDQPLPRLCPQCCTPPTTDVFCSLYGH